jgi:hypothetical protein
VKEERVLVEVRKLKKRVIKGKKILMKDTLRRKPRRNVLRDSFIYGGPADKATNLRVCKGGRILLK